MDYKELTTYLYRDSETLKRDIDILQNIVDSKLSAISKMEKDSKQYKKERQNLMRISEEWLIVRAIHEYKNS